MSPRASVSAALAWWPLRSWPAPGRNADRSAAVRSGGRETSLSPEGIEGLFEAFVDAGEDRRVAQGVAAPLGLAQGHHEIKEVFRLVAFEGHDPFLVVQPKRIRRVELHRREPVAYFDVLVHHALPGRLGEQEPAAGLQERIDEDIFALAGHDRQTLALLVVVGVVVHIIGAFRHGEVGVGRREVLAQPTGEDLGAHFLEEFEFVADPPEHEVAVPADADRRVGDDHHLAGIVLDGPDELLLPLGPFGFRQAPPGGVGLVEREVDELAPLRLLLRTSHTHRLPSKALLLAPAAEFCQSPWSRVAREIFYQVDPVECILKTQPWEPFPRASSKSTASWWIAESSPPPSSVTW